MFIQELKKKNYFRYFQLSVENKVIDEKTVLFFLLEAELKQIFISISDPILRNIKYQWFIDELKKSNSNHKLIKKISSLEKKKINLLIKLVNIYSEFLDELNVIKQWKTLFKNILEIYNEYFDRNYLETSHFFLFSFFLYKSQTIRVSSEVIKEIKSNIKLYDKEINITELTFLEIFLSKFKKINKIEFLFKFYINNFKYLK